MTEPIKLSDVVPLTTLAQGDEVYQDIAHEGLRFGVVDLGDALLVVNRDTLEAVGPRIVRRDDPAACVGEDNAFRLAICAAIGLHVHSMIHELQGRKP